MEKLGSHWKDFRKILYLNIFRKYIEKLQVLFKSEKNNRYFTWRPTNVFDNISVLLRIRNVSEKRCRQNQNTYFVFHIFPPEYPAVYEIMWKNILETARPQLTIWRMLIACWINKATSRHSEYVIIIAVTLKQWSHEHISVFILYVNCLSCWSERSGIRGEGWVWKENLFSLIL